MKAKMFCYVYSLLGHPLPMIWICLTYTYQYRHYYICIPNRQTWIWAQGATLDLLRDYPCVHSHTQCTDSNTYLIALWQSSASQFTVRSYYIQLCVAFFYVAHFLRIFEYLSNIYQCIGKQNTSCHLYIVSATALSDSVCNPRLLHNHYRTTPWMEV